MKLQLAIEESEGEISASDELDKYVEWRYNRHERRLKSLRKESSKDRAVYMDRTEEKLDIAGILKELEGIGL